MLKRNEKTPIAIYCIKCCCNIKQSFLYFESINILLVTWEKFKNRSFMWGKKKRNWEKKMMQFIVIVNILCADCSMYVIRY